MIFYYSIENILHLFGDPDSCRIMNLFHCTPNEKAPALLCDRALADDQHTSRQCRDWVNLFSARFT